MMLNAAAELKKAPQQTTVPNKSAAAAAAPAPAPAAGFTTPKKQQQQQRSPDFGQDDDDDYYYHYPHFDPYEDMDEGMGADYAYTYAYVHVDMDDFFRERREFERATMAEVAAARAAARTKQKEYEAAVAGGASEVAARALLAPHDSVPNDKTELNKTVAKKKYGLTEKNLVGLVPDLRKNRYNPTYAPEKMYKIVELEGQAVAKWGPGWKAAVKAKEEKNAENRRRRDEAKRQGQGQGQGAGAGVGVGAGAGAGVDSRGRGAIKRVRQQL